MRAAEVRRVAIQMAPLHEQTPISHGASVSSPVNPKSSPGATILETISRELASMNPAHERAIRRADRRFNAADAVHAKRVTIPAGIISQKHAERISFLRRGTRFSSEMMSLAIGCPCTELSTARRAGGGR